MTERNREAGQGGHGAQGGRDTSAYRTGAEPTVQIAVTTTNDVVGYRVTHYLGIVRGIVVRSPSIGQGIVGAFKQLAGGNISEYVDVCEAARHEAYVHMMQHAEQLGAHAIIGMRYDATEFAQGATEVLAYGTALRIERA
jgi:uncharacterized protein YbjQ (UPF0145 family)